MKIHDKIPVIALVVIVIIVAGAGPLIGLAHTLKLDLNIAGIILGGIAASGVVAFMFHEQLAGVFSLFQHQLKRLEDKDDEEGYTEDYLQLPQASTAANQDLYTETRYASSTPVGTAPLSNEPVILLATNCPLPVQDALNHTLILEKPGAGQRERSVATRLYIEQLGQFNLPQIIITRNQSYMSVLPLLDNPWVAGKPEAREKVLPLLQHYAQQIPSLNPGLELRYAAVNELNARSFAKKVVGANAQIMLDLSTYSDTDEAGRILQRLLTGIQEDMIPCLVIFMEADRWLPNDRWLQLGHTLIKDVPTVQQLRGTVFQLMGTKHATMILSMDALMPADLRLVRKCSLWLLNMDPDDEDRPFISYQTGLTAPGLDCLEIRTILADVTTQTAMEMVLYQTRSAHEEPHAQQRNTSRLLIDLSNIAADGTEDSRLGKSRAESGPRDEEPRGSDEPLSAAKGTGVKAFSRQQMAYAAALQAAGEEHFTETALRRPPKTKLVRDGIAVTFADLAQELRLKKTLSDEDLISPTRAGILWKAVAALTLEEREEYEQEAAAALNAIIERRGLLSKQPVLVQEGSETLAIGASSRWRLPPTDLFDPPKKEKTISMEEVRGMARTIQSTLNGQRVYGDVLEEYINIGAKILSFGILPTGVPLMDKDQIVRDAFGSVMYAKETRIAEIVKLKDDLQARLHAKKIRMLKPVPGEPYVGVEIPNPYPTTVVIRELLEDPEFQRAHMKSGLVVAIGRDLAGRVVYLDMEAPSTPHLLIAGSTGGGKSVCENVLIASILTYYSPEEVKLVMIDPKLVELSLYDGIPHLVGKVLTEPLEAGAALLRAQDEMERRYKHFSQQKVRNIQEYRKLRKRQIAAGGTDLEHFPSVVIFIDEIAALMDKAKELAEELEKSPEDVICQIAALGRAAGIHLVLATQRPTVDVVTGNIKANIPAKIAFLVANGTDSRVVLDENGAEELEGRGDAIFQSPEYTSHRVQCAFITDDEATNLIEYWKQAQPLSGDEEMRPLDISHLRQQSLLELPEGQGGRVLAMAQEAIRAQTIGEASNEEEGDRLSAHIEAFLRGEKLPFALSDLSNEELYRFVVAWTVLRPTVTRDEIRVCFGISQTKAGNMIIQLNQEGIIGEAQSGGRPRQVLAYQHSTGSENFEETSV